MPTTYPKSRKIALHLFIHLYKHATMSTEKTSDGREERGQQTRDALLSAARSAFASRGVKGASIREIAAAADAHPAVIRYHFGAKADLWKRVVDDTMSGLRDRLFAAIATSPPDQIAATVVGAYLDHLEADPDFPKLIVRGMLDSDPIVLGIARDHLRPLLQGAPDVIGERIDGFLTVFGAAVAPFLYAPLLREALGQDPLELEFLARRRAHLIALVQTLMEAP